MANDKREQDIYDAYVQNRIKITGESYDPMRTYWLAHRQGWDAHRLAAATAEAQADGWVAIETVDDLPKVGGRYLWQFRNVDDGIEFDLRIFKPSMDGQHFVKAFVAWKQPAPYQRQSSEGE